MKEKNRKRNWKGWLFAVMLFTGCFWNAQEREVTAEVGPALYYGDVDEDYKVTADDALLVLKHDVGLKKIQGTRRLALADINHDGKITAVDALEILKTTVRLRDPVLYEEAETPVVPEPGTEPNILVAYFSCTNTTKTLAEYAAETLDADIVEIVPEQPYTAEDLAYYTDCRADREQSDPDARPAINGRVENMSDYDIVFLGYPKL